jgi:hypothetical protein
VPSFPNAIKAFTAWVNGNPINASIADDLQDEVTAIEQSLRGKISAPLQFAGPRPWIDVRSDLYGAKGDGVTDDGPAWNNARAALPSTGGIVFVPSSTAAYLLTTAFTFGGQSNVTLLISAGVTLSGAALPAASGTNTILDLRAGFAIGGNIFQFTNTSAMVNGIQFNPANAGASPSIAVIGTDANPSLILAPRGTGRILVRTSTAATETKLNVMPNGILPGVGDHKPAIDLFSTDYNADQVNYGISEWFYDNVNAIFVMTSNHAGTVGAIPFVFQQSGTEVYRVTIIPTFQIGAGVPLVFMNNPALSGAIRLPNAQTITWRNAANSADINGIWIDSNNNLTLVPGASVGQIVQPGVDAGVDLGQPVGGRWRDIYLSGTVQRLTLTALGGGVAPTLGTIGGTGPATAAQNSWVRFTDSAGVNFWMPAWK